MARSPVRGIGPFVVALVSGPNTLHRIPVTPNKTHPNIPIVHLQPTETADIVVITPNDGSLVWVYNDTSHDVFVNGAGTGALPPGSIALQINARTKALIGADGTNWSLVSEADGGGESAGNPFFTSARVRGMVDANVANLNNFALSGAGRDGITYVDKDLVALGNQTAKEENGPYVVVAGAPSSLIRPGWWETGADMPDRFEFELGSEGANYGGLTLVVTGGPGLVVGTDDPVLLFREINAILHMAGPSYTKNKGFGAITHSAGGDCNLASKPCVDYTKMVPQASVAAVAFYIAIASVTSATVLRVVATNITTGSAADQDVNLSCRLIG